MATSFWQAAIPKKLHFALNNALTTNKLFKMKKNLAFAALLFCSSTHAQTNWPAEVKFIAPIANDSVSIDGDLKEGKIITPLSWASNSSNACFTAGQFPRYQGNHVLFGTTIPPGAILEVTATPINKDEEISLYGYMVDENNIPLVPNLIQCITCEADYKRDKPMKGKALSYAREIEFRNPTERGYSIVIGVAAPKGVTERKFTISIKTIL
jgi:hypothetical protein